ncbi:MAG: flagellar brake protein [Nitrospira sp.]|nr:flagellar brake protein [Nitrospira sp.]MCP9442230.1 flagellar brake protein [Nitrospira sp.]
MKETSETAPPSACFLTVGLAVKLSLVMNGRKIVHGSTLLGWKESAWLICEWPSQLDWMSGLAENTPCTISYLREGKLVGCRTEIRGAVAAPVPLLFLAYPRQVEEMHLRQYPRVSSNEPAVLSRIGSRSKDGGGRGLADYIGGLVRDLSLGGCRIALDRTPSWIRTGSSIRLEFELPGLGHVTNLTSVVKNIDKEGEHHLIGVEFQFDKMEYIEYRGWGGSVRQAIWRWVRLKSEEPLLP